MPERKAFNGLSKGQNRGDLGLLLHTSSMVCVCRMRRHRLI
ncbi:hypothetical protein ECSTEC7V_2255 [Escherichia coli STEC_7v]|nr:hypothetical protein ECSTEC7V_2255 [Escherichia coli STEC_7v]